MELSNKLYLTKNERMVFDSNYKYQMSILKTTQVLNKGAYITILNEFSQFCNQLRFDKNILIKIISKQLSCNSGVDKTGNYYLQGQYSPTEIKNIVYSFIRNYLLCANCDKPEVTIRYKNNNIIQLCRACGHNDYIRACKEDIVMILKNSQN